ncbi:dynein heavy chain, partial [Spiromyces aspiralis]
MEDSGQIGAGSLMPAPSLAGHPSSESSAPVQAVCDPNLVKQYILDLIPVLLGRSDEEDAITALFAFPDAGEKCRQFANDGQVPVLYINKENEASGKEADSDEDEAMAFSFSTVTYSLSFELTWSPTHVGSIAMIKRTPVLDPILPLSTQIQIMNLPGPASVASAPSRANDSESATAVGTVALASANPYEALHAYIHHAMSPYFNAFISAKEKADAAAAATVSVAPGVSVEGPSGMARRGDDKDAQSGIPLAKKKIAELELSLLHLQQNVDIPEVRLNIHPVVIHAVEGARQDGHKRVTVDAVSPDLLADSTFLNHLQSDVNGWIKEIQKVTKLDRDPSSGTASQEINFWQSMERALNHIEEQLNGDEVVLTMQILKAAKRFHAT